MKDLRTTTLPSILTEYFSEFEENRSKAASNNNSEESKSHSHTKTKSGEVETSKQKRVDSFRKPESKQRTVTPRSSTPGRVTSAKLRKEDKERQERVADYWDIAKTELLQDRHDQLAQKVVLQHSLIKRQEQRAEDLRRHQDDRREKKRNEELYSKHARENALQEKCKESIESDRKSKQKSNAKVKDTRSEGNETSSEDGFTTSSPLTSSPVSPVGNDQRLRKTGAPQHRGYLPSSEYSSNLAASPMKEIDESEDDEGGQRSGNGEVVTPADLSQVPWHHAQLYRMYGRHADYYLHPKVQQEQKKVVHPTLKSQKVKKMGHLGASHIWHTLRHDSKSKLYASDRRFPQELKDAFSSHVRQGINNNKKAVFRNFTVAEDVPDLNRLMDQSLLRRVAILRHKTELMYRSSKTNNDRTKVLLFNSPLPAVTEGDEGIGKYLPSWTDDSSEGSEASYTRWLDEEKRAMRKGLADGNVRTVSDSYDVDMLGDLTVDGGEFGEKKEGEDGKKVLKGGKSSKVVLPKSVLSPVPSETCEGLQTIWHSVMARQKPRKEPRYHFLTEEEAREQGAFLEKLGLDKDRLDQGRVDLLSVRDHSMSRQSLPVSLKSMSAQDTRRLSRDSLHGRSESAQALRFRSAWQPLSMNALIEYKDQMGTQGLGEFQQGRPRMWPNHGNNNNAELQQQN